MGGLLYFAVAFLVIAIIAALFGFGGVAGVAVQGAQILFWVAIVPAGDLADRRGGPADLSIRDRQFEVRGSRADHR